MKKKIIALSVAAILLISAIVGGTLAYLTDKDYAENTMVMGNVNIEQLEYERVVDENGNFVPTGETDKYGYHPNTIQEFNQDKPLYPVVGEIAWAAEEQSWGQIGAPGSLKLMAMENVVDKFVFVKNTGKSDAYVRTIVALEQGDLAAGDIWNVVRTVADTKHWAYQDGLTDVVIEGNTYYIMAFTYAGPSSDPTGILAAGAVTYPSLAQVFMTADATNEDIEAVDGNNNGKYDILVLSQAVQTNGFDNADAALDTAFGDVNAANVQGWFTSNDLPEYVATADELRDALAAGQNVILSDDIALDATLSIPAGSNANIDLAGNELSFVSEEAKASCAIENKGSLTISNGTITYEGVGDTSFGYGTNTITNSGKLVIDGATVINTTNSGSSNAIDNAPGSSLIVNDGVITSEKVTIRLRDGSSATINGGEITGARAIQIHLFQNVAADTNLTINGGTFTGSELALYSYAYGSCTFDRTNVTITGGTFNGDVAFGGGNKTATENVSITGGTFNGYLGRYLANDGWEDIAKP